MTINKFSLYAVFVAGAVLFLGTEKECIDVAWSMYMTDNNVADTLAVREY